VRYAMAFIILPGGFGTMDEFFEALTLIQTRKIRPFPVFLVDSSYWRGLMSWLEDRMVGDKMIAPEDLALFRQRDDPEEIVRELSAWFRAVKAAEEARKKS
ncbi:MAG: LOG family protein, partial [bacterium]